uniref:Uncharacterized protein n=1 Tax=Glossina palpalis gambiensis TaxID=67801 RepID=A0A1B0BAF2_9MUSC
MKTTGTPSVNLLDCSRFDMRTFCLCSFLKDYIQTKFFVKQLNANDSSLKTCFNENFAHNQKAFNDVLRNIASHYSIDLSTKHPELLYKKVTIRFSVKNSIAQSYVQMASKLLQEILSHQTIVGVFVLKLDETKSIKAVSSIFKSCLTDTTLVKNINEQEAVKSSGTQALINIL